MFALFLDVLYALALVAAVPWLLYRRCVQGKRVAGFWDKLTGRVPRRAPERPCVWFHAVSVGEVLQLQTLVAEFAARHPDFEMLITASTATGAEVARQKFAQHTVAYWPFDFSWAVSRALRTVRPTLVALVELELWPNFLAAARRQSVPVVVVNGRITERSARGYRRLRPLAVRMLRSLAAIAVQNEEYAERFAALGAPRDRLTTTGNIKFDRLQTDRRNSLTQGLRQSFGIAADDLVFIAGSTQAPEEEFALDAWLALRAEFPQWRLVLVPRHKERFEEVARLVASRGLPLLRRTQTLAAPPPSEPVATAEPAVCLLDTLGELAACWGLADIAFVGGSLTRRGGQNMIEPAAYGAAVLFGPNTWNFRDVVEALRGRDAAIVVHDAEELQDAVRRLAADESERRRLGETARDFVLAQRGAAARTLACLEAQLPAAAGRRAA